jgi:3',5'-cyclic AMP phosphodiesterase CpdA
LRGELNRLLRTLGINVVLVDSTTPGRNYGTLDGKSLAWLEGVLAASPGLPALVLLHHPPFITGISHMDVQNLRNAGDLAAIVRRQSTSGWSRRAMCTALR